MRHHQLSLATAIAESQRPAPVMVHNPALDLSKPCIQAPGHRDSGGYAEVTLIGRAEKRTRAHRMAYEREYGPVPPGLAIDHACHNEDADCHGGASCLHRGCIEPAHLRAVSNRVNTLAGKGFVAKNARKTHCKNGHALTPDNVDLRYLQTHGRRCIQCCLDRERKRLPRPRSERGRTKAAVQ